MTGWLAGWLAGWMDGWLCQFRPAVAPAAIALLASAFEAARPSCDLPGAGGPAVDEFGLPVVVRRRAAEEEDFGPWQSRSVGGATRARCAPACLDCTVRTQYSLH